jgi:hypothetical protein
MKLMTDINTTYLRSVISHDIMSHDRSNKNMTCTFCRKQNNKMGATGNVSLG